MMTNKPNKPADPIDVEADVLGKLTPEQIRRSPVLKRLVQEVRDELKPTRPGRYDRVYHRHNR